METPEPQWKNAYPVPRRLEHQTSRRGFGKSLGAAAVACAGVAAGKALVDSGPLSFEPIRVCGIDELPPGRSRLFRVAEGAEPGLLLRLADGRLRAYSQSCTHLMCPVHFDAPGAQLVCPCHEGFFDAEDGAPMAGPPRRPLPPFLVDVRADGIWVGPQPPRDDEFEPAEGAA